MIHVTIELDNIDQMMVMSKALEKYTKYLRDTVKHYEAKDELGPFGTASLDESRAELAVIDSMSLT